MYIAKVMIERPVATLDVPFSYYIPSTITVQVGIRVVVEFNKKVLVGYVEDIEEIQFDLATYEEQIGFRLLPILNVLDEQPIINEELKRLAHFLAKTTLAPLIVCYQALLPPSLKPSSGEKTKIKYETWIQVTNSSPEGLTKKQAEALQYFIEHAPIAKKDVVTHAGLVTTLIKKERLSTYAKEVYRSAYELPFDKIIDYPKTPDQIGVIESFLQSDKPVALLEGVTGSGKTEVYIALAKHYLDQNKNILILVPEISLTPVMVKRFRERFDVEIAVLHSGLSAGEKYDEYRRISRNEVRVVIGARSAIFAPLQSIGLIVIDEEHSETYKQDSTPSYHALSVALQRASYHQCRILLGSATPSLESKARAVRGVYHYLHLAKRIHQTHMPAVTIVDMTIENKTKNYSPFSRLLLQEMEKVFARQEQVILLLNRRGFSPSVNCKSCGYTFTCPHCEVSLNYHRTDETLKCHYCGYHQPYPLLCPSCQSRYIRHIGTGTQKIEQELQQRFPQQRILRMDLDTTSKKDHHVKMIQAFDERQYDVLLGTQMISKGFDFPNVTLVGVINADVGLYNGDFRNNERTFQLLTQVAGRSGRSHLVGQAIIQTYNPQNYAIQLAAKHDYAQFFVQEMQHRKLGSYPPYTYLCSMMFQGKQIDHVEAIATFIKKELMASDPQLVILGPAIPYIAKINQKYRFRLLIKTKNMETLIPRLLEVKNRMLSYPQIEWAVDTSPYQNL